MRTSKKWGIALSVLFAIISLFYLMPIAVVLINSFKDNIAVNSNVFALPNQETFVGWSNYVNGLTSGAYPFLYSAGYSFMITILSAILILLCTSMAAWYISRVDDIASRVVYFLCVFSMVVPFQMVMFTLARTAYTLKLNTPWSIPVVYLGFGAGLAVFMFSGFVKGMPLAMEEAAAIDGCGPIRTFFGVVLPIMKPIFISVGVLEIMWVWNDYLLPYLVLDSTKYKTIPIHIQYLQGSYGHVDLGAMMALIMLSILPIIIFYLCCQKYIIAGGAGFSLVGTACSYGARRGSSNSGKGLYYGCKSERPIRRGNYLPPCHSKCNVTGCCL